MENSNQKTQSTTMQRAAWLASLGCSPLPVAPAQAEPIGKNGKPLFNGKNPSYLDADGKPHIIKHTQYRENQPTTAELQMWFANPANGIGTLAGGGGIDWIDLDRKNFSSQDDCDNARAQILERCDRTYFEKTKSGGAHIAVRLAEPKSFTNFQLGNGKHAGEFLGEGRFVVLAPTAGYESLNGNEIGTAQSAEALGLSRTGQGVPEKEPFVMPTLENRRSIDMDKPPVAIDVLISKKCKDLLKGAKSDDISRDLTRLAREVYGVAEWYPSQQLPVTGNAEAILQKAANNWGVDSDRLARILESVSKTGNLPGLVKHGGSIKAAAWFRKCRKSAAEGDELCAELRKIRDLRAYYGDRLAFNQLSQKIEIDNETIEDIEGERIAYIESTNKNIGVDLFCTVVRVIANESAYHPVAVYLEQVAEANPDVDESIFENVAGRYFGASDPLYSIYIKRWMMSAVARAMNPGCKVDTALFLVGGQGKQKSTFFKTLAGEEFFSDALGDATNNKDEVLLLSKFWIHEWSELETVFRKKEQASVKAFMARTTDSIRPPYRRDLIDLKRSCVFAGSTNEQSFLSDNTGDRRFWVIPMSKKTPVELVRAERDKLWAAAVALFKARANNIG